MSDSSACHGLVCIQVACDMLEASWMFYETHEHNTCHNWEKLLNKMSHTRIDIDTGSWGLNQRGYSISSPVFSGEVGARAGGSNTTKSLPKRLSAIWDVWECRNVSLWNPEYRKILQLQETRIPLTITIQIHVPQWSWLESGLYGVESRIRDCVKFPRRWGKISRQETYYVNTPSEKSGGSQKRFFMALWASVRPKNERRWAPRAPPLNPPIRYRRSVRKHCPSLV